MTHQVVFAPEAEEQLVKLYRYIAEVESAEVAANFTNGIVDFCEGLQNFPLRGTERSDIRQGLRITHFKNRTIIAFAVFDEFVSILGIYYGGQDYEKRLAGKSCEIEH
ncbi:MAG: plasmid stabilization protein [Desulfovibrio sp. S3730MH75]|nr:MAG: plasmid stabilization protein [Desulfovibrio sp. S3730MH75]